MLSASIISSSIPRLESEGGPLRLAAGLSGAEALDDGEGRMILEEASVKRRQKVVLIVIRGFWRRVNPLADDLDLGAGCLLRTRVEQLPLHFQVVAVQLLFDDLFDFLRLARSCGITLRRRPSMFVACEQPGTAFEV